MKLGTVEILLLLGLALVIFGPAKLPELGKTLGKTINEFKNQVDGVSKETKDETNEKQED